MSNIQFIAGETDRLAALSLTVTQVLWVAGTFGWTAHPQFALAVELAEHVAGHAP
jgi:hypothetical protein